MAQRRIERINWTVALGDFVVDFFADANTDGRVMKIPVPRD